MGRPLFARQWIAAVLSTVLALSGPIQAYGSSREIVRQTESSAADGDVAIYKSGDALIAIAQVPESQENAVIGDLSTTGNATAVMVRGPDDPAYGVARSAAKSNTRLSISFASEIKNALLFSRPQFPKSVRQELFKKVGRFADRTVPKSMRKGLLGAVIYAGGMGAIGTFYFSAGVDNGLKIFAGLLMTYGFIVANSHGWEKLLDAPGNVAESLIAKVFGEVSPATSHATKVLGVVASSWFVNTVINAFVFDMSGHLDSIGQAAYYGFLANYAILDASVVKKVKRGDMSEDAKSNYYLGQMIIGTVLECAGIAHFPGVQPLLGIMSISAFLYLLAGDERVDGVVMPKISAVVRRARVMERRRKMAAAAASRINFSYGAKYSCPSLLASHVRAAEDLW